MVLKKELTLYERDEKGELIPKEVELQVSKEDLKNYPDMAKQTIHMIPIPRGKLKKIFNSELETKGEDVDGDAEIIMEYCKNPVYTEEDIKYVKPVVVRSITRTILSESGVHLDDSSGARRIDENDEFGKNS